MNKMEKDRKDKEPKVIQLIENMDTEYNETPQSTANKSVDKKEPHKQMQKQKNFNTTMLGWISRKPERLCNF